MTVKARAVGGVPFFSGGGAKWRIGAWPFDPCALMLVVFAVIAAIGVLRVAVAIGLPHPYGDEGWNAYHAAAAMAGHGPYPPIGSLMVNNYPPLSFYIVGAFGSLLGDYILAGRILSLLSFFVLGAGIFRCARSLGCSPGAGLFASLYFFCVLLFDSDYVGLNDPQLLGQAFQTAGLAVLLQARQRLLAVLLAAALMTVGVFIKHNLLALPLAAGLWLIVTDRKSGAVFVACGAGLALTGLAVCDLVYGRSLLALLNAPRVWWLSFALNGFLGRLPEWVLPLAGTVFLLRQNPSKAVQFGAIYVALSLLLGFWFLGGAGCSGNVVFDVWVALGLCGALAMDQAGGWRPVITAAWFISVVGMLVFHAATHSFKPRYWLQPQAPQVSDTAGDVAFLRKVQGPVLTKEFALTFWAGKPVDLDLRAYEQAVTTGHSDGQAVLRAIAQRRYAVMLLGSPPNAAEAPVEIRRDYAAALNAVITANYRVDHTSSNGTFWVPRQDGDKR